MGARLDESDIIPSVPPGFGSLASFTLQKVQENILRVQENVLVSMSPSNSAQSPSKSLPVELDVEDSTSDEGRLKKSLRHRPWVNYSKFDNSSDEEEPESEAIEPVSTNLELFHYKIFLLVSLPL